MVLGLGDTGISVIRHLRSQQGLISACDSRLGRHTQEVPHLATVRSDFPDVRIVPPRRFAKAVAGTERVVASPGVALDDSLLKFAAIERIPVVGDIDLFFEAVKVPVIGITGTNGKSTTTTLVGEMLQDLGFQVCGNIGLPVLDALRNDASGYVVELSSFQLERLRNSRFEVAAITNIAEDHLDHHRSMEEYVASKHRIYINCKFAVYNALDSKTRPLADVAGIAVNEDPNWRVEKDGVVVAGSAIPADEIALKGTHNHFNLVAASAIAHHLGASLSMIRKVIREFSGLAHRSQFVASIDGVEYINDSKATNVAATVASINGLSDGRKAIVLIAGGDSKNANFSELTEAIAKYVRHVVLIGRDASRIAASIEPVDYEFATSLDDAVVRARKVASSGDRVLLAPACASFDMFRNFEHRGEVFSEAVRKLVD